MREVARDVVVELVTPVGTRRLPARPHRAAAWARALLRALLLRAAAGACGGAALCGLGGARGAARCAGRARARGSARRSSRISSRLRRSTAASCRAAARRAEGLLPACSGGSPAPPPTTAMRARPRSRAPAGVLRPPPPRSPAARVCAARRPVSWRGAAGGPSAAAAPRARRCWRRGSARGGGERAAVGRMKPATVRPRAGRQRAADGGGIGERGVGVAPAGDGREDRARARPAGRAKRWTPPRRRRRGRPRRRRRPSRPGGGGAAATSRGPRSPVVACEDVVGEGRGRRDAGGGKARAAGAARSRSGCCCGGGGCPTPAAAAAAAAPAACRCCCCAAAAAAAAEPSGAIGAPPSGGGGGGGSDVGCMAGAYAGCCMGCMGCSHCGGGGGEVEGVRARRFFVPSQIRLDVALDVAQQPCPPRCWKRIVCAARRKRARPAPAPRACAPRRAASSPQSAGATRQPASLGAHASPRGWTGRGASSATTHAQQASASKAVHLVSRRVGKGRGRHAARMGEGPSVTERGTYRVTRTAFGRHNGWASTNGWRDRGSHARGPEGGGIQRLVVIAAPDGALAAGAGAGVNCHDAERRHGGLGGSGLGGGDLGGGGLGSDAGSRKDVGARRLCRRSLVAKG